MDHGPVFCASSLSVRSTMDRHLPKQKLFLSTELQRSEIRKFAESDGFSYRIGKTLQKKTDDQTSLIFYLYCSSIDSGNWPFFNQNISNVFQPTAQHQRLLLSQTHKSKCLPSNMATTTKERKQGTFRKKSKPQLHHKPNIGLFLLKSNTILLLVPFFILPLLT